MSQRRLLLVHAHPDDECVGTGATMAKYVDAGADVTLLTCTLGEEGEVLTPDIAHYAAAHEDRLGAHREEELAAAMAVLGVTDHRFLGGAGRWRDSGMMGEPSNDRPDCFWRADLAEAATEVARVVREVTPQVLVTYDPNGGYGHPDHIQAHRVAMYGALLAAAPAFRPDLGPAWDVPKVYWTALPRSAIERGIQLLMDSGESNFFGVESADDVPFAVDDALVTTVVDARPFERRKMAALRAHASQVEADGGFFALAEKAGPEAMGLEYYSLVKGVPVPDPDDPAGRETDLFAGVT